MEKGTFYLDKRSNEVAYTMASIVSESDKNLSLSPIVLYGESGNGKSHIVSIITGRMFERKKKVLVINAEEFVSRLINNMKNPNFRIGDFCQEFEQYDALILEDAQYLKNKASSQSALVDITSHFVRNGSKLLIITMNCKPHELSQFDEKLKSQFECAIQIQILPPSYKFKKRIVKMWNRKHEKKLDKKTIKKISRSARSVGELLAILKQLDCYTKIYNFDLNKKLVLRTLKERGLLDCKDSINT